MEINWMVRPPEFIQKFYAHSIWKYDDGLARITFDDGPSRVTEKLIQLLNDKKVKATFFVLSEPAKKYASVLKFMLDSGHNIGLHSSEHQVYWRRSKKFILNDLKMAASKLENIVEKKIDICRAPHGWLLPMQDGWISKAGFKHWFWSCSSLDFRNERPGVVLSRLQNYARKGDVILFHDGIGHNKEIIQVIEQFLETDLSFEKLN